MSEQKGFNSGEAAEAKSIGGILKELGKAIREWFRVLLDLQDGLDREGTIVAIKTNKRMRGANAWLLGCSIMIASLGLDLNSPAVIIGAMLVSPLMSPILGIGLGVGLNDKDTLLVALQHFGVAIVIALVTSTFYFFVSPFGQMTSEIQSRTSPTVLDGLVAIFGGLAGIISTTRKDKSNAIPGVAIATALMPPLCVTGFGLAELLDLIIHPSGLSPEGFHQALTRTWGIIGGSFYLFFLNSFFIALTAFLMIRLLRFPLKTHVDKREARRNSFLIVFFSLLVALPSAAILYQLYLLQQDKKKVDTFITDYFPEACIKHDLTRISPDTNKLILQLLGRKISQDSILYYETLLSRKYGLHKPVLLFPMQAELGMEDLKNLLQEQKREVVSLVQAEREATEEEAARQRAQAQEAVLQSRMDSVRISRSLKLAREAFPEELAMIRYAPEMQEMGDSLVQVLPPAFLVQWVKGKGNQENKQRLEGILKVGSEWKALRVLYY
ncbi:MAG: DUF389 domain-containing protein [Lewinellaceae bacterium]|nr:DUF389 domain-containing protein [Lewinellaceae bacterium]